MLKALCSLLLVALSRMICHGQVPKDIGVSIIKIQKTDAARPAEELIRKYLLRPAYRASPNYIFSADTTALPLLQAPAYGIYYFGKGRTDHSQSRYQIVYFCNQELLLVKNQSDLRAQKKLVDWLFKTVGLSRQRPEHKRVLVRITELLKENQEKTGTSVF